MPVKSPVLHTLLFILLLSGCGLTAERQPLEAASGGQPLSPDVVVSPDACHRALQAQAVQTAVGGAASGSSLSLLVWNIRKGSDATWREDLSRWASDSDLILLQEAIAPGARSALSADHDSAAFAPGYARGSLQTGVATLSQASSSVQCRLRSREPWLRTPKATLLTRHDLGDPARSLLVLNTHMINFTLGTRAYRRQLAVIEDLVAAHQGPVIVAGDFNTWNGRRQKALEEFAARRRLLPVHFSEDSRSRFLGKPLDHVLVGGATVEEARSLIVDSSDHNPIWVSLRLAD